MKEKMIDIFKKVSNEIIAKQDYLTKLDDDGDHGNNMTRGFKQIKKKLTESEFENNSEVLKEISKILISKVGGAAGPLYGTAFLKASNLVGNNKELSFEKTIEVGEAIINGIQQIGGGAKLGDKTMLDTIIPAVNNLKENYDEGNNLIKSLPNCLKAAEEGMQSTIALKAKKGRSFFQGERSIGHQDPGATSSYLIIKTIIEEIID